MMKYVSDAEIEAIEFTRHPYNLQIATFDDAQDLELLRAFVGHVFWGKLDYLAKCVANAYGCGFEVLSSRYDDEFDPDEENWTGVQISNDFGDEPIVLSKPAYERFCLRLLDFAEASAKAENSPILSEPVWSEVIENRERLRARLELGELE
jgi:hypothetical protein